MMQRLPEKWIVNPNASGWQTSRIWAMLVLIGICLGMLLFNAAYSQDDMGGMDMGGMDPGMGGMDPGMGGMDPGMGGMDPGMGGMEPGMPDSAGLPLDPGPVMPDAGNMPGDTGMPPPTPDRPDGMDGPNAVPPPQPNPVIDPYWLNGGWGMGYGLGYGLSYGYGGYGGLGYGTYGRTYPMSIVPRHGTLSQAQVHHGHIVMVPHFYSHTTKKLYPMVSHETLKSEETTKTEASKKTDPSKTNNTEATDTKTVDNTKTNTSKATPKSTSTIPSPESDHVAVPVVPYKVGSQTHAMPVFHPAPVPQMRIDPAPYSPAPMFDTYPGTSYRSGGALGPNYHTPVNRNSPMWGLSMPMGGGGFLTMPIR